MSAEVYAVLGGDIAMRAADDLADVYREAFAGAPHHEPPEAAERFRESIARHAELPGFRAVAAWAPGADLVGFGYGHTSLPGQWWHDRVAAALAPDLAERWLHEPFVVVILAVRPRRRREGIGGRLHDLLLESAPHPATVLTARQDDEPAQRLYHGRGWQEIGRDLALVPGGDPFVILARRLTGHPGIFLE
jgi:ribosomal protein S18 acetylase RimI-like enzyme